MTPDELRMHEMNLAWAYRLGIIDFFQYLEKYRKLHGF